MYSRVNVAAEWQPAIVMNGQRFWGLDTHNATYMKWIAYVLLLGSSYRHYHHWWFRLQLGIYGIYKLAEKINWLVVEQDECARYGKH